MGWKGDENMIEYSLGLVIGYAFAKGLTPIAPKLLTKKLHIHHWIWATALLIICHYLKLDNHNLIIGALTGIALQGLSYKNWSLIRKETKL